MAPHGFSYRWRMQSASGEIAKSASREVELGLAAAGRAQAFPAWVAVEARLRRAFLRESGSQRSDEDHAPGTRQSVDCSA
eukprot:CAMPEP_0205866146 /NCGR_PEP_ID=MMETSP1083-20121108/8264_1 /ASSEMBLY_ACC=CAM_ASM_000430 /TAXON_ID=97485 /ORGANISM="Prymnesium parvum, Strain Texoma1" /LENGTH=79 /DNA_ID=CAMNT_0053228131 /DNA_START=1487 /DNA_END=1726 /DNA_ORIENTATION=+